MATIHHRASYHTPVPTRTGHQFPQDREVVVLHTRGGPLDKLQEWISLSTAVRGFQFVVGECLTYPFTVFCRQCQIFPYNTVGAFYSIPWRTLVAMQQISQTQGIRSWWRGWQTHILLLLGQPTLEAIFTRILHSRPHQHRVKTAFVIFAIKGFISLLSLPLLSFSLLQSVQNTEVQIYSPDYNGFKEFSVERPLVFEDASSHRLSYLQLAGPTFFLGLSRNLCTVCAEKIVQKIVPRPRRTESSSSVLLHEVTSVFLSSLVVDLTMYPLETLVARLHCQGLPVLVENVETGAGVQYITSFHRGLFDCALGVWEAEGLAGFYKGLSALFLKYAMHGMLVLLLWKLIKYTDESSVNHSRSGD